MVTPRTLPSGSGPDDAGPEGSLGLDVTSLIIDLTGELERGPPPPTPPACQPVVREALAQIAVIHAGQLPDGFFVRFGCRFLAAYHATFVAGPHAIALSVGPPEALLGFVVGTSDNPRHYHWLAGNAGPLVGSALLALSVRPGLAFRLLRTRGARYTRSMLRSRRQRAAGPELPPDPDRDGTTTERAAVVAVLTHVAVVPQARGAGLGRVLVEAFVAHVRSQGADEVRLIAHVATPAPAFYRSLGWCSLGERRASDGSLVEEFQLVL